MTACAGSDDRHPLVWPWPHPPPVPAPPASVTRAAPGFDQGLGNLFVTRTAGQVLDDAVMGSIQYGVAVIGTPLIVVLGHQDCGAVTSTVAAVPGKAQPTGTDIDRIVDAIAPAVIRAQNEHAGDLVLASTKFNVDNVVAQPRANSALAGAQAKGTVRIAGGYYDIGTGRVAIAG